MSRVLKVIFFLLLLIILTSCNKKNKEMTLVSTSTDQKNIVIEKLQRDIQEVEVLYEEETLYNEKLLSELNLANNELTILRNRLEEVIAINKDLEEAINDNHQAYKSLYEKEISYQSEGTEYVETFIRVENDNYPIYTFIPKNNWTAKKTDDGFVIQEREVGSIEFIFYSDEMSDEDIYRSFFDKTLREGMSEDNMFLSSWIISSYNNISIDKNKYDLGILGRYKNQYFAIFRSLGYDYVEEFIPIERVILNEIYYTNKDDKLESVY